MRCHYWIFNTRNSRETIESFAGGPYVSSFQLICVYFVDKNADRDQNCSFDLIYFQRSGVYTLIFPYVPYIVTGLVHGEPANFYREKRRVAFVTGHLFTFLVVLSLICLVTTQILICENQIIWRLEILLRTIVAALLKTKCNGHFVKNKRYQETGKEYFTIVQMIVKDDGY